VANDDLWLPAPNNDSDTSNAGGHGTHVAGVAAGRYGLVDGVIPVHGAAPDAALVALGIADNMVSFAGFAGMYWALEHHADPCGNGDLAACPPIRVVNNSWGLFDGTPSETEDRLQRALIAEGVTVVWAGGNDGGDGSSALTNIYARTPVSGSLLVAGYNDEDAGTPAGAPSWFSSRGKAGDQVTYPDVAAPADHIMSSCRPTLYVWCYAFDETLQYSNLSGTSLAAPHVAGIVAQLIEADPSLTPAQIETLLKTTAFPFAAGAAYEAADGGGKTSFDKGHGLVDAKAAIARLRGIKLPGRVVPLEYTCGPGGVIGTDPAEDVEAAGFTYVFTPEPALDLRGLSVRWDSNASALRFTISVEDLPAENPATTPNASWSVVFEVEDQLYFVAASRDFTGTESFGVGVSTPTDAYDLRVATAPASGELDPDQDTIDLVVSSEALQAAGGPPLEPGTILDRVRSGARRSILAGDAGDTAPFSDIGFAQCPVVVGEE
jgi:subtilisin family serine protease